MFVASHLFFCRNCWTVFSGGMPRASYGDKFTVTAMKGEDKHVVFDLTSKVVDFVLALDSESGRAPETLFVLAEEELVVVDLRTEDWAPVESPYLNSIHGSAVTCLAHVSEVNEEVYGRLSGDGGAPWWPASGGKVEGDEGGRDVLITGHEDGSVKVWACGGVALSLLSTVKTNKYFVGDDLDEPPGKN